ncbi:hypothetical protein GCM10023353_14790 [Tomitella cavernea]|uniref:DUF7718 domain-containing protein n=1 Tax=Tomitella cavernea TaxID=1387982 RepID=A0ABP9CHI9_9ACTN
MHRGHGEGRPAPSQDEAGRDTGPSSKAREDTEEFATSSHGRYAPPSRASCRTREWAQPFDDGNTVQRKVFTWRANGLLVDFVILTEVLTASAWQEVERIDCCHGHCHLHDESGRDTPRALYRLDDVSDVDPAFQSAIGISDQRMRIVRGEGG